jgi:hypothetical protein
MMVRPAQRRTREQAAYLDQLIQSNKTIAVVFTLAQDFGRLLRKRKGKCDWSNRKPPCGPAGLLN